MIAPYYADESVQLFLGDAREMMPQVVSGPCTVITDPPYGDTSLDWDRWPTGASGRTPAHSARRRNGPVSQSLSLPLCRVSSTSSEVWRDPLHRHHRGSCCGVPVRLLRQPHGGTGMSLRPEFDDVEFLRRWRREALALLLKWDDVFSELPEDYKVLSASQADCVRRYIVATRDGVA